LLVCMRFRKPCSRFRGMRFGWYVRLPMTRSPDTRAFESRTPPHWGRHRRVHTRGWITQNRRCAAAQRPKEYTRGHDGVSMRQRCGQSLGNRASNRPTLVDERTPAVVIGLPRGPVPGAEATRLSRAKPLRG
jgi:hypothetical protein